MKRPLLVFAGQSKIQAFKNNNAHIVKNGCEIFTSVFVLNFQSTLSPPIKNRATVPGPVWLPMVVPME